MRKNEQKITNEEKNKKQSLRKMNEEKVPKIYERERTIEKERMRNTK